MTAVLQLLAILLVGVGLWLLLEWQGDRITRQMHDALKAELELRSRPAPGFDVAPDSSAPQVASAATRAGVEPPSVSAPPAPQNLVGAASTPPQAAPTRSYTSGGRGVTLSPSPALAGLDTMKRQLHQAGE